MTGAGPAVASREGRPRSATASPGAPVEAPGRAARWRWPLAVGAVVAVALGVRLWGIGHGLPFAYHGDENAHFVPVAIRFFDHGLNPKYFVNPPGYSELLYLVFGLRYGFDGGAVEAFRLDPGSVILTGRLVSAVLGAVSVWLLYLAGARFFDRRAGLLAAGILAVAFLPVFYAHQALNDAASLAPFALSLLGTALVLRRGHPLDWALAGGALGLGGGTKNTGGLGALGRAAGRKYTCGLALLPLAATAVIRLARGPRRPALLGVGVAIAATFAGFLIANPYAFADWDLFVRDLRRQSAGVQRVHVGQDEHNGFAYYGWGMAWGLGWLPAVAAAAGALLLALRDRALALVLVPAPILMLLFVGNQTVFFARYALPVVPLLCLLAAYAAARLVALVRSCRPRLAPVAWAGLALALCAQGVAASVHGDGVLARADTRNTTRSWLLSHLPAGTKIVVGPILPKHRPENGLRWLAPRPGGAAALREWPGRRDGSSYERARRPSLLDRYARAGSCWVVTASTRAGFTFVGPRRLPGAIAYYRALERRGRLAFRASPFAAGAPAGLGEEQVRFQWDWSWNYYPREYERPGPVMSVYRLTDGACR